MDPKPATPEVQALIDRPDVALRRVLLQIVESWLTLLPSLTEEQIRASFTEKPLDAVLFARDLLKEGKSPAEILKLLAMYLDEDEDPREEDYLAEQLAKARAEGGEYRTYVPGQPL